MTTTNNAPISFRLTDDELELLRQHQEDGEKSLNLTAKRLLLNTLGVDAKKPSIQVVNSVDMVHVQELIETAVQEKLEKLTIVDNVDTIKNLIAESLADGVIGEAIATSYAGMMGQFNGLLEEFQLIKKQMEELKSVPPSAAPVPPSTDIENLLGIGDILAGNPYDLNYLNNHIGGKLNEHKNQIEAALRIKLNLADPKYICREFNKIIRGLGYEIKNKQINKIETYWIETNNDKVPK